MKLKEVSYYIIRLLCSYFLLAVFFIGIAIGAPQGGEVQAGDITIGSDPGSGIDTLITQTSQKGVIDWQSFSIGEGEHTHFAQPGASAITLNRVRGGELSSILGQLTATGQVWLINPAGILIGANARIDVSGLLATTSNISNEDFLAGNYHFVQGLDNGVSVTNRGYLNIVNGGMAFLLAPQVENSGLIEATLGKVLLGSVPGGSEYVLDFYGDQLISFTLTPDIAGNVNSAITQSGVISAAGGKVLLTVGTAKRVVDTAINMSGIIEASSIGMEDGTVVLTGGEQGVVNITGEIRARGEGALESGGAIRITGEKIGLFGSSILDVSGVSGGGEILIGGNYLDGKIVATSKAVYVAPGVNIFADAISLGSGGRIIVWSKDATRFYGRAQARGGVLGGAGGFVETSSNRWLDVAGALVDVSAPQGAAGTWLIDPYNVDIVSTPPSSGGGWSGNIWSPSSDNSQLYVGDILTALNSGNVQINTGSGGTQAGNIVLTTGTNLNYTGVNQRTLELIAANDIDINAEITGTHLDLLLSASGNVNINTTNIDVGSFQVQAVNLYINGLGTGDVNLTTVGNQVYDAPLEIYPDVAYNITSSGNVTFNEVIEGPGALTIYTSGNTTLNGIVGGITPLDYLTVFSGIRTYINSSSINTINLQNFSGGDVILGGASPGMLFSSISGPIIFNSNIAGGFKDLTFDSGTGDLELQGVSEVSDLVLTGSGDKRLLSFIGNLTSMSITGGGTTTIGTSGTPISIATNQDQTYAGPVVTAAETYFMTLNSGGDIIFNDAVTLGADATMLTHSGGNLVFNGAVNGPYILTIDVKGNIEFNSSIGDSSALSSLLVLPHAGTELYLRGSLVSTLGAQYYQVPVILDGSTPGIVLSSVNGPIIFADTITGNFKDLTLNSGAGETGLQGVTNVGNLSLLGTGNKNLAGTISNVGSIDVAGGDTTISAPITTIGDQTYSGPITLAAGTTLNTTGIGAVIFNNTINGGYKF
jgi:filamentous hemagglutinin family protein